MAPTTAVLRKFYIYDPGIHAGDELGRLRVVEDDKGLHVMAPPMTMQYWIDQGVAGLLPISEVSEAKKKLIAQTTRGRSESDDTPKRLPKYDKQIQSGAPGMALKVPLSTQRRQQMIKARKKGKNGNGKKAAAKKPEPPKSPTPPPTTPYTAPKS
jgi:hypothetical protein